MSRPVRSWTDSDLLRLDREYAWKGIPFHLRQIRAVVDILGHISFGGRSDPAADAICEAYERLVPETGKGLPPVGVGLAASVDRVCKVHVPLALGTSYRFVPEEALGIDTDEEWSRWCRGDSSIGARSYLAVADAVDFAYGLDDLRGRSDPAIRFWTKARSHLAEIAEILSGTEAGPTVTQAIFMTAELSLKAVLLFLGETESRLARRDIGHSVVRLAELVAARRPHRDDPLVGEVAESLPDYVNSRYSVTKLTRLDLVQLALGVQFVAASSVRRVGERDLALQMESSDWPGTRGSYTSW